MQSVIRSFSYIQATDCGITYGFYSAVQCSDGDSLIDGNLGVEMGKDRGLVLTKAKSCFSSAIDYIKEGF